MQSVLQVFFNKVQVFFSALSVVYYNAFQVILILEITKGKNLTQNYVQVVPFHDIALNVHITFATELLCLVMKLK